MATEQELARRRAVVAAAEGRTAALWQEWTRPVTVQRLEIWRRLYAYGAFDQRPGRTHADLVRGAEQQNKFTEAALLRACEHYGLASALASH